MQEKAGSSPKRTARSSRDTPRSLGKGARIDRDTKTRGDKDTRMQEAQRAENFSFSFDPPPWLILVTSSTPKKVNDFFFFGKGGACALKP